ncbi:hypothetical protein KRP22_012693 [Phytophthora ramorum]|nr:hypothetical protein KRP22_12909 [Phytophthora ramorum]
MHEAIRTHSMETGKLVKVEAIDAEPFKSARGHTNSTPDPSLLPAVGDTSDEDFDLLVVPQLELLLELHFELAREHPTTKMEKYAEREWLQLTVLILQLQGNYQGELKAFGEFVMVDDGKKDKRRSS